MEEDGGGRWWGKMVGSALSSLILPKPPFVSSEVETRRQSANVSRLQPKAEVYPERLPWQAVEGLDTNGV
jgi:hypothetical protein